MSKDYNKCASKQPCNPPSDNSEVCYKVKCEPKCEKDSCIKKCPCYSPEELVGLYKDAVVEIHSEFILLGTGVSGTTVEPATSATGGTPLAPGRRTDVILEGNGFFIKGHYIVAPAQLVLMPPSLTSVVNRYPLLDPADIALGRIRDQMVRASRILVSVFNVNGKGHSFVYEAELVGVDGAGDIAVLRINYKKQWNLCNPYVEKCHPYFNFGSSRGSKDGEKIYVIGDYVSNALDRRFFNAVGAIADGLLSDHRYLDYAGFGLSEAILISAPAYAFSAGMPIINCQGQVIGMQTSDLAVVLPHIVTPAIPLAVTGGFTATGAPVASTGTGTVAGLATFATGATAGSTGLATFTAGVTAAVVGIGVDPDTGTEGTGTALLGGLTAEVVDVTVLDGLTASVAGTATVSGFTAPLAVTGTVGSTGLIAPLVLNQAEGLGLVAGPSEFFMRRVVKALIKGSCSRKYNCQLDTVCDPAGTFYRYKKAYAGIAYDVFTGVMYDTTADFTSGSPFATLPRVRLTSTGEFLSSPSCKELIGIRVVGLAGLNPNDAPGVAGGFWYIPGGTATVPVLPLSLPVSPFLGKLFPGDVITHINGVPIGDLNKQVAPSLITWRLCAGDQLEICYRRGGSAGNTGDNSFTENYDNLYSHTVCLADYPLLMDYPWYAVNRFPLLVNHGFTFPAGQLTNLQLPALVTGSFFHPAI